MLALCSMLSGIYYAQNYASIIGGSLNIPPVQTYVTGSVNTTRAYIYSIESWIQWMKHLCIIEICFAIVWYVVKERSNNKSLLFAYSRGAHFTAVDTSYGHFWCNAHGWFFLSLFDWFSWLLFAAKKGNTHADRDLHMYTNAHYRAAIPAGLVAQIFLVEVAAMAWKQGMVSDSVKTEGVEEGSCDPHQVDWNTRQQ